MPPSPVNRNLTSPVLYACASKYIEDRTVDQAGIGVGIYVGRHRRLIYHGRFDVVVIGRALLADPAWVNRLREGALDGFNGYNAEIALSALA